MSNIRNEYNEFKQDPIYKELETDGDLVLITERLNRSTVNKLNNSIARFDKKFSPYNEKLPAIAGIIKTAEDGLYLVLTGKMGSRNASKMLERMSIIHNILSDFFGRDLAMLLKMPYFKAAQLTPDIKLNELAVDDHNVKVIQRTFSSALKPSESERKLFRKVFKNFEMPTLNWNEAAKQLVCLTFNELSDLSDIERIPMVVADLKDKQEKEISDANNEVLDESGLEEAGRTSSGTGIGSKLMGAAGKVAGTTAKVGVAGAVVGAVGAAAAGAVAGKAIYNRFKSRSAEMTKEIDILQSYVKDAPGFEKVSSALNALRNQSKVASQAKFSANGGIKGFLSHPSVVVMKQAVLATKAIEGVITAWNEHIGSTYANGIKPEDLPLIKKELDSRIKGGMFAKLGKFVAGVKPFPGLSADDIIAAVMALASQGVVSKEDTKENTIVKPGTVQGIKNAVLPERLALLGSLITEHVLTEDYKELEDLVTKLSSVSKSREGKADDDMAKELTNDTKAAPQKPSAAPKQQMIDMTADKPGEPEATQDIKDKASAALAPGKHQSAQASTEVGNVPMNDFLNSATTKVANLNKRSPEEKKKLDVAIAGVGIKDVKDTTSAISYLLRNKNILDQIPAINKLKNLFNALPAAEAPSTQQPAPNKTAETPATATQTPVSSETPGWQQQMDKEVAGGLTE